MVPKLDLMLAKDMQYKANELVQNKSGVILLSFPFDQSNPESWIKIPYAITGADAKDVIEKATISLNNMRKWTKKILKKLKVAKRV